MPAVKVDDGVHWVGALDPQLRVFDIIMKADHGTTYNAFLLNGGEKVAVVEAVKAAFYDDFNPKTRKLNTPR